MIPRIYRGAHLARAGCRRLPPPLTVAALGRRKVHPLSAGVVPLRRAEPADFPGDGAAAFWPLPLAIAVGALAASGRPRSDCDSEALTFDEALAVLKAELEKVRKVHRSKGGQHAGRKVHLYRGGDSEPPSLSLYLPSLGTSAVDAMQEFARAFGDGASLTLAPAADNCSAKFVLAQGGTVIGAFLVGEGSKHRGGGEGSRGSTWLRFVPEQPLSRTMMAGAAGAYANTLEGFLHAEKSRRNPAELRKIDPFGNFGIKLPNAEPSFGVDGGGPTSEDPLERLQSLGAEVFSSAEEPLRWDAMAGYDAIKREVSDTVVLALQHPDAYDSIARQTRQRFESNRPKAVLFEGPPGTGKTLCARILASQAGKPFILLRVERMVSKWYGESEKRFGEILDQIERIDGGAVLFIDEIDALAQQRGGRGGMHEATRRLLGVLLQRLEGFTGKGRCTLVAATNRRQDLDAALLSRFDLSIAFDLPDESTRSAVIGRYAKQLTQDERNALAGASAGMSCRDLKEVCEHAERRWASKQIRGEVATSGPPPLETYLSTAQTRRSADGKRASVGSI